MMRKSARYELLLEAVRRTIANLERSLSRAEGESKAASREEMRDAFKAGWYESELHHAAADLRAAVESLEGKL